MKSHAHTHTHKHTLNMYVTNFIKFYVESWTEHSMIFATEGSYIYKHTRRSDDPYIDRFLATLISVKAVSWRMNPEVQVKPFHEI